MKYISWKQFWIWLPIFVISLLIFACITFPIFLAGFLSVFDLTSVNTAVSFLIPVDISIFGNGLKEIVVYANAINNIVFLTLINLVDGLFLALTLLGCVFVVKSFLPKPVENYIWAVAIGAIGGAIISAGVYLCLAMIGKSIAMEWSPWDTVACFVILVVVLVAISFVIRFVWMVFDKSMFSASNRIPVYSKPVSLSLAQFSKRTKVATNNYIYAGQSIDFFTKENNEELDVLLKSVFGDIKNCIKECDIRKPIKRLKIGIDIFGYVMLVLTLLFFAGFVYGVVAKSGLSFYEVEIAFILMLAFLTLSSSLLIKGGKIMVKLNFDKEIMLNLKNTCWEMYKTIAQRCKKLLGEVNLNKGLVIDGKNKIIEKWKHDFAEVVKLPLIYQNYELKKIDYQKSLFVENDNYEFVYLAGAPEYCHNESTLKIRAREEQYVSGTRIVSSKIKKTFLNDLKVEHDTEPIISTRTVKEPYVDYETKSLHLEEQKIMVWKEKADKLSVHIKSWKSPKFIDDMIEKIENFDVKILTDPFKMYKRCLKWFPDALVDGGDENCSSAKKMISDMAIELVNSFEQTKKQIAEICETISSAYASLNEMQNTNYGVII